LLGNRQISGMIQHSERILRIRLKESRFDEGRRAGNIVVLQDITDQERKRNSARNSLPTSLMSSRRR
jgi:signal transduction histidine kinase